MEFKEIVDLVKLINKSNLTEFKMTDKDFSISIRTKKYNSRNKTQHIVSQAQQPIIPVQPQVQIASPVAPPAPAPAAPNTGADNAEAPADKASNLVAIKSPIVGTFYRSASPDKPPYLKVGDQVEVGQVVCIVEAMKLFNEIESEVSGKVVEVVTDDASPVEYDQPLFMVDPNG